MQWATLLPLQGKDTASLVGRFRFAPIDASNRVHQKISSSNWYLLTESCTIFGIMPPTLGIIEPVSSMATN